MQLLDAMDKLLEDALGEERQPQYWMVRKADWLEATSDTLAERLNGGTLNTYLGLPIQFETIDPGTVALVDSAGGKMETRMRERVIDTLKRLMAQAAAAEQRPILFAMSPDDWAEVVNDAASNCIDVVSDPEGIMPQKFMGVPVEPRDMKGHAMIDMIYEDGTLIRE